MPLVFLLSILAQAPAVPELPAGVAWVRAENDGAGAGFVIDVEKRLLLTCRHIVADRAKVDVIFPWSIDGRLVTDRKRYLANRVRLRELGLLVTGTVRKQSDELDLALLELDSLPSGMRAVSIASAMPGPGESLRVVGNRIDMDTVWNITTGPLRVSGRLADGYFWRGKKLAENAEVLIGQLPTEEGDSGGPVFDSRGRVVGMAAALRRQSPQAAIAISATELRAFAQLPPHDREDPKIHPAAQALNRATVWIRPAATDVHLAGVLVDRDLILTIGKGLRSGDRIGIAIPIRRDGRWIAERAAYRDPLALELKGNWRAGRVLACDANRDLALVRIDTPVEFMKPLRFASSRPAPGDAIHTMNHPGGLEFSWVYSQGSIRQIGRLAITAGDRARPVDVLVCQLPAQAGSPGGAVVNDRGELLGLVAAKESAQMVGYAVTAEEITELLDVALVDRPARTAAGLVARIEALPHLWVRGAALALARRADEECNARQFDAADRDALAAIALDSGCGLARLVRSTILIRKERDQEAMTELDQAVEKGQLDRTALVFRAELAARLKEWRKARGDLERILDAAPADAEARRRLVGVQLGLGENTKAATAVADVLRADPKLLPVIAADLLEQAGEMAKKYPDVPSIPAGWLAEALAASKRDEFTAVLKSAAGAKTDAERLAELRAGIAKIAAKAGGR